MDLNTLFPNQYDEDVLIAEELEAIVQSAKTLIIHNDDFNSFDFVIETLIDVCRHNPLQAEQCTYIIHYSGKCAVKTDMFKRLQPLWAEITKRGITATIEDIPEMN